jgi:hypothetical protein
MGSFDAKNRHRKSHAWAPLNDDGAETNSPGGFQLFSNGSDEQAMRM